MTNRPIKNEVAKAHTHNSTYKQLKVQWLNEALCFILSLVVVDSFVLRKRQLLVAAKRYWQLLNNQLYTQIEFL